MGDTYCNADKVNTLSFQKGATTQVLRSWAHYNITGNT